MRDRNTQKRLHSAPQPAWIEFVAILYIFLVFKKRRKNENQEEEEMYCLPFSATIAINPPFVYVFCLVRKI